MARDMEVTSAVQHGFALYLFIGDFLLTMKKNTLTDQSFLMM
jgi:hypothetical protein